MDTWTCIHAGCPIRKSAGRWIFAPNRSFSQLITSFVGSQCQGILLVLFLAWPLCLNLLELFEIVRLSFSRMIPILIFHILYHFWYSLLSQCISSIQFSKYKRKSARIFFYIKLSLAVNRLFGHIFLFGLTSNRFCNLTARISTVWTQTTFKKDYTVRVSSLPRTV